LKTSNEAFGRFRRTSRLAREKRREAKAEAKKAKRSAALGTRTPADDHLLERAAKARSVKAQGRVGLEQALSRARDQLKASSARFKTQGQEEKKRVETHMQVGR